MRFAHARLYRDDLAALTTADATGAREPAARLVTALCPRCDAGYCATCSGAPDAGREARRAARAMLDRECPDHPHAFTIPD